MPTPLRAAAMVPATWVPWSLVVGSQPVVLGRPASTQLTEFATSRLATRSGWSASMPLSSTPTRTLREPSVILWAWSALIICMSHCSASRGSAAAAGASTPGTSPLTGFLAPCLYPDAPLRQVADRSSGVPSETATLRVAPTESRALPATFATSVRKAERSECATTTPICGHACTTTPPAFFTALLTTVVWPGLAVLVLSR